jgi:predicted Fe-Mo cluster-binding NifX family protein
MHFGHCEGFALVDVDLATRKVLKKEQVAAPAHQPGVLPPWLADQGVDLVIAGGMGMRAQQLFTQSGIEVIVGAPSEPLDAIVSGYLDGSLKVGQNICDH